MVAGWWRRHGPVLGAYAVLTAVVLWPAVANFRTRPLIGGGDSSIFYWAWWWVPRAVERGVNTLVTNDILYPVRVDLTAPCHAPAGSLLSWPLGALVSQGSQAK